MALAAKLARRGARLRAGFNAGSADATPEEGLDHPIASERRLDVTLQRPPSPPHMNWSLIAAVNNEAVLRSCLLNSPAAASAAEVILQGGFATAGSAYNFATRRARADL